MGQTIASIGGVLVALITAVVGYLALRAKKVSDKGASDVEVVKVSLTSLQAALTRSDLESEKLRLELVKTEAELATLRADLATVRLTCQAELADASLRILELARQVQLLGGQVNPQDAKGTMPNA